MLNYPTTNNRISSETINGATTRSFTYDGAGNTLTGLPAGAAYALDYSKRNRPSALKQSGTTVTSYLYNAMEQLSSRAVASPLTPVGTTHYSTTSTVTSSPKLSAQQPRPPCSSANISGSKACQ